MPSSNWCNQIPVAASFLGIVRCVIILIADETFLRFLIFILCHHRLDVRIHFLWYVYSTGNLWISTKVRLPFIYELSS